MVGRGFLALMLAGGSSLLARAAPQQKANTTMSSAWSNTTAPPCTLSVFTSGSWTPWCEMTTETAHGVVTSNSTGFISTAPLTTIPTTSSTTITSKLTSSVPTGPVQPSLPHGQTTTSSTTAIISSASPPFTNSSSSTRPTSDVPNFSSTPLMPTGSSSSPRPTSDVPNMPPSDPLTSTSATSSSRPRMPDPVSFPPVATTNHSSLSTATFGVPEPEDTSRSVTISTHMVTETITTKTTSTDTEYPPSTSVIDITTTTIITQTMGTTTWASLPAPIGPISDGQIQGTRTSESIPANPVPTSSTSAILDPITTSATGTEESSKSSSNTAWLSEPSDGCLQGDNYPGCVSHTTHSGTWIPLNSATATDLGPMVSGPGPVITDPVESMRPTGHNGTWHSHGPKTFETSFHPTNMPSYA